MWDSQTVVCWVEKLVEKKAFEMDEKLVVELVAVKVAMRGGMLDMQ
jgi:hypothetical protein